MHGVWYDWLVCLPAGEYPLASSSAAEKAEGDPKLRKRRGETVVLAFSQQGWGERWVERVGA